MPIYRVRLSDGRTVRLEAAAPPSEAEVLAAIGGGEPAAPMLLPDEAAKREQERLDRSVSSEIPRSFMKAGAGAAKSLLVDMPLGVAELAKSAFPDSPGEAAMDVGTLGASAAARLGKRMLVDPAMENFERYGRAAREEESDPWNQRVRRLQQAASLIPGWAPLQNMGDRAVSADKDSILEADPFASGELLGQIPPMMIGTRSESGFRPGQAAQRSVGGALEKWGKGSMRRLFPRSKAAEAAIESGGLDALMKHPELAAFTREGLRENVGGLAGRTMQEVSDAKAAARGLPGEANLEPAILRLESEIEKRSPAGTEFGPEFTREAQDLIGRLDEMARGGPQPPGPPQPWAPAGFQQAPQPPRIARGPVPISDAIDAFDALGERIPESTYTKGALSIDPPPVQEARRITRAELSDALKESTSPIPFRDVFGRHREAARMSELVDTMPDAPPIIRPGVMGVVSAPYTMLADFIKSPAWRSIGAIQRARIGRMIAAGQVGEAWTLAQYLSEPQEAAR